MHVDSENLVLLLSHTRAWLMYLEQYSKLWKHSILSGIKSFSLVSWVKKEYQQAHVSDTELLSFRSEFFLFYHSRGGFKENRLLWPQYLEETVTRRSSSPSACAPPLKYAADLREGHRLEAWPSGKLRGEKKKSCSTRVFWVHKRKRIFDLSCDLLSSQEKSGSPRHSPAEDTAHELLMVAFHHMVSAPLGFSLTYARTCSNDIPPNPLPLMWFILNREFQLQ